MTAALSSSFCSPGPFVPTLPLIVSLEACWLDFNSRFFALQSTLSLLKEILVGSPGGLGEVREC